MSSLPGLTRQSISLSKKLFSEAGWMRGSSPRMTSECAATPVIDKGQTFR
jgi:hypothetical protein